MIGGAATYQYDNLGRLILETDAEGGETAYAYDAAGRLLTLTDPEQNETSYVYDALGRQIEETNELEDTRSFEYNAAGLLVEKTDRNERITAYEYDNLYRLLEENWLDSQQQEIFTIAYTYDALGRVLTSSTPSASYTYEYDALGRLTEETQTIAGLASTVVFSYQYSAVGNLTQVATTIGGTADAVTDYEYDALGRVTRIEQYGVVGGNSVAEKRIDLSYDARSQYATISYYNDTDGESGDLVMMATYTYDSLGRLTDLVYTDSTPDVIRDFEWVYNAVGNILSHNSDIASEDVDDYDYDATNQLTDADYTIGTDNDESYEYDDNGNRVLVDGSISYTTGDNNQTTSDGTYTFIYDAEGNMKFRLIDGGDPSTTEPNTGDTDITEYEWDYHNRLTEVADYSSFALYDAETPDSVVDYIYDCFNHRVGALYDTDGDGDVDLEERYVWQGKNVALDFVDSDGDGGAFSDELTNRYLWGQAVDQLFAQEAVDDGGVEDVLYPVRDNLGSTRSLVEYDGDIVSTFSYDSYGNVTVLVGTITDTRFLFTCQEYDVATGFYYYDARWYDPTIGKYISEDPVENGDAETNLYLYVFNNPILWTDASGLWGDGNAATGGNGYSTRGHSDFPGYPDFDWTLEDKGDTAPHKRPDLHFRSLDSSEKDLASACQSCNHDKFIRAGHDMQDFFSHYGQGYRPIITAGHVPSSAVQDYILAPCGMPNTPPDDASVYSDAYGAAKDRTQLWLDRWNNCCEKGAKGVWKPKSPQPKECSEGPPNNPYGDKAPKPTERPGAIAEWFAGLERAICRCYGVPW